MRLFVSGVLILLSTVGATASPPCTSCSEVQYPDAEAFLAAHGYPASDHTVLLSWSERTRDGSDQFITGYHVRSAAGKVFDLYSDGDGNLLSEADVAALGIKPKNWDLPPVEKLGESTTVDTKWLPAKPTPVSVSHSISPRGGAILPEIDWAEVAREDKVRADAGKSPTRIGVFVDLQESVVVQGESATSGSWVPVDGGGRLWSFAMLSPDALGMRVHFSEIALPLGARVVVYNGDEPQEAYGPYFGPASGATDLWSATVFGESVVVECFVPDGADLNAVHLTIDRVTHNYVPFETLAMAKGAGSCNLDVTCFPSWADAAKGVAGVGSVNASGSIFCTGSLLADTDSSTSIPYFLTANHCIGSQSGASNLEVYWLYQTSTCNGVPPNLATVPRTTGGADMLATTDANSGTDFALMRLNNNPPAGITFLGWASAAAAIGTPTTCIHHPSADFKRLTFGDITNIDESLLDSRPRSRYHQSSWRPNLGVTEPGSSGSPLFIESTQQVIGQLWGGPSSCSATFKLDYYGRFDVSFPLIEQYLDPDTTIDGTVEVTVPNSEKSWRVGTRKRVKWVTQGNIGPKVKIDLYLNGNFVETIKKGTKNDGKAAWDISPNLPTESGYYIRVTSKADNTIFDNSDSFSLRD